MPSTDTRELEQVLRDIAHDADYHPRDDAGLCQEKLRSVRTRALGAVRLLRSPAGRGEGATRCEKCGGEDIHTRCRRKGEYLDSGWPDYEQAKVECLRRYCRTCGYGWTDPLAALTVQGESDEPGDPCRKCGSPTRRRRTHPEPGWWVEICDRCGWVQPVDGERDEGCITSDGTHCPSCWPEQACCTCGAIAPRCNLPPSKWGPCELDIGHAGPCRSGIGTMEAAQWIPLAVRGPSSPAKSTEGNPELLERMRRRAYPVHNHGPEEGPSFACREALIGDCLREELHSCAREGYRLFHREQAPGTVGERWCRWAQTLGWPSLTASAEGR